MSCCSSLAPNVATYAEWEHYVEDVPWNIFDVQSRRSASSLKRLLEDRQERFGILRQRKSAVRDQTRGIVQEGDEVRFTSATLGHRDAGSVHDIAHPQLPGVSEGEFAPILRVGLIG